MNTSCVIFCTTRIVARAFVMLCGRLRGVALALAFAAALAAPSAVRAQCPAAWVPGVGFPGIAGGTSVRALAVLPGGDVIAGGLFTTAGGVSANGIARYNPSTGDWSALGIGTGRVDSLAVLPGGDVLVGGSFSSAGGVPANNIARYNPGTGVWSALGAGVGGVAFPLVRSLAVLPGGDVLAGGLFTTAGGVSANRIARYNPGTGVWSALGTGTNDTVRAIVVLPGGDVIAGGEFTTAGGVSANRIARYFPGAPSPSILWQPVAVATTPSGPAVFSVVPTPTIGSGVYTYQWLKNGVSINTTTNPSAASSMLVLNGVQAGDLGSYSCVLTSPCGGIAASNAAVLSFVRPTCGPSDVAGPGQSPGSDGQLTADDIIVFLNRFFAGC
jgi:hypothetical protein